MWLASKTALHSGVLLACGACTFAIACGDDAATVGQTAADAPGNTPLSGGRNSCPASETLQLEHAQLPDGFCAWQWAADVLLARGVVTDDKGNVLAVSEGSVIALWDDDGDGVSGSGERMTVAEMDGLNHGLALHDGFLYASSPSAVFRWRYAADRMKLGDFQNVIGDIPSAGGHVTRTLAFDDTFLYVSVGSGSNLDQDSSRSRIRRFPIARLGPNALAFNDGEVFADGLRNEVGLAFDSRGRLWGVENGRDNLSRQDLDPADIHQENPAEELNLFAEPGRFYGYPYCWSEFSLPSGQAMGPTAQWADPERMTDGIHDDAWCRKPQNVVRPVLAMQAHSAPLDVLFYTGKSFPQDFAGDAIVTFHGSWNREPPTGYKVMRIPFGMDGMPNGEPQPLLEYAGDGDSAGDWPFRPVDLAILPNGAVLVSSDSNGDLIAIGYRPAQ